MDSWFIEGFVEQTDAKRRLQLRRFPFTVGRTDSDGLMVPSNEVSRVHAQFIIAEDQLFIKDCGSTNGTFVNQKRISREIPLQHGDVIRFANMDYRVIRQTSLGSAKKTSILDDPEATGLSTPFENLKTLIRDKMVTAEFQPILAKGPDNLFGYEVLGRGSHPNLTPAPTVLFEMAKEAGLELELCRTLRNKSLELAANSHYEGVFFLNTHPIEMVDPLGLFGSLRDIRLRYPELNLVLEIHEQTISSIEHFKELALNLKKLRIQIAYDDFGAGQTRLLELVECPPDFIKFDIAMIQGIDKASRSKFEMLDMLIQLAQKEGIKTIAEGISTVEEANVCLRLGFDYLQGFFFGRPRPVNEIVSGEKPFSATRH